MDMEDGILQEDSGIQTAWIGDHWLGMVTPPAHHLLSLFIIAALDLHNAGNNTTLRHQRYHVTMDALP